MDFSDVFISIKLQSTLTYIRLSIARNKQLIVMMAWTRRQQIGIQIFVTPSLNYLSIDWASGSVVLLFVLALTDAETINAIINHTNVKHTECFSKYYTIIFFIYCICSCSRLDFLFSVVLLRDTHKTFYPFYNKPTTLHSRASFPRLIAFYSAATFKVRDVHPFVPLEL